MNLFLGGFADTMRDWWNRMTLAIHNLNPTVKFVIVGVLALISLICLISFIKPAYSTDKHKVRIWLIIVGALFAGAAIFLGAI